MTTYYCNADTGNNGNPGSEVSPWLTILYAHTTASDGDTIILQDSVATYTWDNIAFVKNLAIQGEQVDASGAVIDGASGPRVWSFNVDLDITIEMSNLTFQNAYSNTRGIFTTTTGLYSNKTFSWEFQNCKLISLWSGDASYKALFGAHVYSKYGRWHFYNTEVINILSVTPNLSPIFFFHNFMGSDSIIIEESIFEMHDAVSYPRYLYRSDATANYPTSLLVKNSIIANKTGQVITWNNGDDIYTETVEYSDIYAITSPPSLGTGSITSDPLFVDENNGNLNLRPSSPCIDTGTLI